MIVFLAVTLAPCAVRAATVLTVDLSTTVRPVTHVGSGSLYGLLEKQPADINALVAPLHPNMFNNPAADVQQPIGDAIVVAGRVSSIGARVTIRLADWFPGWPYGFTNMTDWFDKLGQTVSRRQTAGLTNIYAYEIWNEPDGTWKNTSLAFNDFWKQTYAQLRKLDPDIKITGPSISYFNQSYLQSFLSYCKTNNCLPDIVGWHELSGGNVTGNVQNYRNLEKQLGIGPLPITINEYSGGADLSVEGQPGASAPLIAKFERLGVDTACISFWDVSHPGRLGSLLATNTDPNGGWWFYKWYGDMAGNMVATTPPNTASVTALDGFANLDTTAQKASVLFGGVNDGSVQIVVKGFAAAPFFGTKAHVVVEHTPFVNRTTTVKATDTVSTADVAISGDQITVSVTGANNTDGYRVSLTPVGGSATGGGGASGGLGGGGGRTAAGGAGGHAGSAGSPGAGGGSARGGATGSGGGLASGGTAGGGRGGSGTGGAPPAGSGGATAEGGRGGTGTGGTTATGGSAGGSTDGDGGCSCGIAPSSPKLFWLPLLAGLALLGRGRRRS
ncbi:MAG TPA: beta-xylosidase [Polyangia bacterium]|nr:beta-xylosidase [Polyangia bacterium]